jgi:soluble lytic murein transglycosylase
MGSSSGLINRHPAPRNELSQTRGRNRQIRGVFAAANMLVFFTNRGDATKARETTLNNRPVLAPVRAVFAVLLLSLAVAARPAMALDMQQAERDGRVVAEALAMGAQGDWASAESYVAGSDRLLQDIVLWRKLRAGKGSASEYQDYLSRRGSWPGHTQLRRVVYGERSGGGSAGLSGSARESWNSFSRAFKRRQYERAGEILRAVSTSAAALGAPEVWAKRRLSLARRAAREGFHQAAYDMAANHFLSPVVGYSYSDCEWVAGWVALRKLNNPQLAIGHFRKFRDSVETPISIGRGGYWLGRAYEAAGNQAEAQRWYADGARFQTSFYGQLAAAKIGQAGDQQLAQGGLPDWRTHPAMRGDDVRLGATLYYADQDRLAMAVFNKLGQTLPEGALAPLTRMVLDLGQPHYAVRIAKKAARRGVVIHPAYYPLLEISKYATKVEPAFALSIARQETELNPRAVSPAGARGLMQLMPGTAKKVAGWIGEEYSRGRLTTDWRYNVRLGETYLARRTEQFSGSYVMAAAAYNAGASRVDRWNGEFGDPRTGQIDILDWMEQIPFDETRNYVQRVMEGLYVYRARLAGRAGPMTIEEDLGRGIR